MPVEKLHPRCRPRRRSSRTSLDWGVLSSSCGREGHPLCPRFPVGGHGFPTPSPLLCLPMLCLHVSLQRPKRHLLPTPLALDPTPLPLPVRMDLSHHPSNVSRLRLLPRRLEWAADHTNFLPDFSPQNHPI